MRVLIIGINGFIGRNVANRLAKNEYEIYGIDRFQGEIMQYHVDIFDVVHEDMASYLSELNPEVIINCAGQANVPNSIEHPDDDFQENTVLVHKILFAMKQSNLSGTKFIQLSSAAVYGNPSKLPIEEDADINPLSPYAMHKVMAEDICRYFVNNYNFNITILRIFSVYGPGLRKQIFWDLYQKVKKTGKMTLYGTGNESRDYIFIEDLLDVFELAIKNKSNDNIVWNVACGKEVYIKEVAQIYASELGIDSSDVAFTGDVRQGDPINWCADISVLKAMGFEPKVDIKTGISKYVEWIRSIGI